MDISKQSVAQDLIVSPESQLMASKVPKPFSIESIISTRSCSPHHPYQPRQHHENLENHFAANLFAPNLCLPASFPIYNPWMGYLTQSTNERISQIFSNSSEKFSQFLENSEREKLSEMLLAGGTAATMNSGTDPRLYMPAAMADREKLAQYFANNVRDPKLSEFLLSATSGVVNGAVMGDYRNNSFDGDDDRYQNIPTIMDRTSSCSPNQMCNSNVESVQSLSQFFGKGGGDSSHKQQQQQDDDKDEDLDSAESCSDLSLTMSPDGCHKNAGKYNFAFIMCQFY